MKQFFLITFFEPRYTQLAMRKPYIIIVHKLGIVVIFSNVRWGGPFSLNFFLKLLGISNFNFWICESNFKITLSFRI